MKRVFKNYWFILSMLIAIIGGSIKGALWKGATAIEPLGKQIINEHISHCIAHAVEEGDTAAIEEFQKAIQKYL